MECNINFNQNEHYSAPYHRGETPTLSDSYEIRGINWGHDGRKNILWGIGLFTPLATRGTKTPKKIIEKCLTHTYIGLHSSNSHHTCDIRALIECTINCNKNEHYSAPYHRGEIQTLSDSYKIRGINWGHDVYKKKYYGHKSYFTLGHQGTYQKKKNH
ncbi:hypothetical protein NQD34_018427 [Periophthalmus magnuspinnatus]|nr:hypothetical protein NQD34_018427 [Periophthalmus magnuspinnatus]